MKSGNFFTMVAVHKNGVLDLENYPDSIGHSFLCIFGGRGTLQKATFKNWQKNRFKQRASFRGHSLLTTMTFTKYQRTLSLENRIPKQTSCTHGEDLFILPLENCVQEIVEELPRDFKSFLKVFRGYALDKS